MPTIKTNVELNTYRDRLRWHLQRVDAWIGNADTKATVLLGLEGAITAAVITLDGGTVKDLIRSSWFAAVSAGVFAVSMCFSMFYAIWAIFPDIGPKRGKEDREPSIYHFTVLSADLLPKFRSKYRKLDDNDDLENLENQVHTNSEIATHKFRRIQSSVKSLRISLACGLLLISLNLLV